MKYSIKKNKLNNAIISLVSLAFFSVFLIGGIEWLGRAYYGYQSQNWPYVTGRVTSYKVHYDSGSAKSKRASDYELRVEYNYLVPGKGMFASTNFSYKDFEFSSYEAAERFYAKIVHDNMAVVYFDPENPSKATLVPIFTNSMIFGPAILFIVGAFGIFLTIRRFFHWRGILSRKRKK